MDASKANQPPSSIPPSQPVNPYSQDGVVVSAVDLYARQGYEGIPDNYIMPVAGPRLSFSFPAYGKERIESEAPLDEKASSAFPVSPCSPIEGRCHSAIRST